MTPKSYFFISGLIFLIVAVVHLIRIMGGWAIVISDWSVPLIGSWIGLIISAILAFYGFRLAMRRQ